MDQHHRPGPRRLACQEGLVADDALRLKAADDARIDEQPPPLRDGHKVRELAQSAHCRAGRHCGGGSELPPSQGQARSIGSVPRAHIQRSSPLSISPLFLSASTTPKRLLALWLTSLNISLQAWQRALAP